MSPVSCNRPDCFDGRNGAFFNVHPFANLSSSSCRLGVRREVLRPCFYISSFGTILQAEGRTSRGLVAFVSLLFPVLGRSPVLFGSSFCFLVEKWELTRLEVCECYVLLRTCEVDFFLSAPLAFYDSMGGSPLYGLNLFIALLSGSKSLVVETEELSMFVFLAGAVCLSDLFFCDDAPLVAFFVFGMTVI